MTDGEKRCRLVYLAANRGKIHMQRTEEYFFNAPENQAPSVATEVLRQLQAPRVIRFEIGGREVHFQPRI